MTHPKIYQSLFILPLILLMLGAYYLFLPKPSAPQLNFRTINNQLVNLKQLQGQPVLITFWASNCPSCLKEIVHFKSLYQDYHAHGLEIIAIAMQYDRPNYVVAAAKNHQIPYHIVLDLHGQFAQAFGDIRLTPTTLLINPQGNIEYQITGLFDLQAMQKRIESLLKNNTTSSLTL